MTKTIDQLNSLLRGEISAVETYKMAIEKLTKASFVSVLRDCLASHERRVTTLGDEIRKLGGTPAKGSGAWGTFAKLFEGSAAVFGEKAAIAALEEGEDHGRNDYERELADMAPPTRQAIEPCYQAELETHAALSNLKKQMKGESPKFGAA